MLASVSGFFTLRDVWSTSIGPTQQSGNPGYLQEAGFRQDPELRRSCGKSNFQIQCYFSQENLSDYPSGSTYYIKGRVDKLIL
jgi:hypothetical protein